MNGASIKIGGNAALANVIDSNNIDASTPAHAPGSVDIIVTNPDSKNITSPNAFTYT
jgi:large repetitive protein